MSWYKKAINMVDTLAMTMAQMMIASYSGAAYGGLEKSRDIVSNIPDERTLSEAIAKAIMIVSNTLKIDPNTESTITSVIQDLQNAFFTKIQVSKFNQQIEPIISPEPTKIEAQPEIQPERVQETINP